jgi:hypothetical protein
MTAAHCGFCGRPLPAAPAAQQQPAKTIMGYALPQNFGQPGAPAYKPGAPAAPQQPQQPPQPQYGVPPAAPPPAQQYAAPPPQPQPQYQPPQPPYAQPPMQPQQPQYGAQPYGAPTPQAPPAYPQQPQYGAPAYGSPQPPPYAAPQQPAPGYGQAQPGAGYGQPQQPWGQPQAQPQPQQGWQPQQPQAQPGYGHGQPQPAHGGALAHFAGGLPQSKPGTLFGIPFSVMHDQAFLNKVLGVSAIALVISRFIPVSFSPFAFVWTGDAFRMLIWPIIAAAVYAAVALAPRDIQERIPPPLLKWGPFFVAYFSTGWVGVIGGGLGFSGLGGMGALSWTYPLLVFGMLIRIQDPDDMIARYFVGAAAIAALGTSLSMFNWLFHFGGVPFFLIIKNLLTLVALLLMASCLVFAIPTKWVPQVAQFEGFANLVTAALVVWPLVDMALMLLVLVIHMHLVVTGVLAIANVIIMLVAFFGVLLLTAPAAYQVLKGWLARTGVPTSVAAFPGPQGAAPQQPYGQPPYGQPPYGQPTVGTIEQRIAELDAAWQRGGMTVEEYQQRRAAIMQGR